MRPGEGLGRASSGGGGPALGHELGASERREAVLQGEVLVFGIHLVGIGWKRVASSRCGPVRESRCGRAQTRGLEYARGGRGGYGVVGRVVEEMSGVAGSPGQGALVVALARVVSLSLNECRQRGARDSGRCNRQNTVARCDWTAAPRLFTCPECLAAGGEKPRVGPQP